MTEPSDGRPEDLGQFAVLLALVGSFALLVLIRDADQTTVIQVVAATAVVALAVGGAASAVF